MEAADNRASCSFTVRNGRRRIVEVVENFPEECRYVLETLGGVYHYDALVREQGLSPDERLRFHQEHSGPLMKGLHEWMDAQVAEHKTEPNSGLRKAIPYLLNHWPKLTLFSSTRALPGWIPDDPHGVVKESVSGK